MTAAQMLAMGGFPDTPKGRKDFYSKYPNEQAFKAKFGKQMAMGGLTNEVGFPQQPIANKFYSEGFKPSVPFGFYQDGGNQQEAQMQQLMAKIAQELQQGAQPQQILQELVKMGLPQDQAAKILQTTIQYLQQHPSPQQAQGQPQEAPEEEAQEPVQQQGPEEEQMEGPQMAYGGYTDEVAFPQQPTANHFYNSGWKPSTPFGFYEEGGLTNEIAFPQQPVDAWIHAHTPYVPSYNVGGGLPSGANDMPCMNCGGYMQDGGSSDGSANQYGGNVGMGNTYLKQGGVKKLARKQKGGSADGDSQDDYLEQYRNAFVSNLQNNALNNLQKEAQQEAQQHIQSVIPEYFSNPTYASEQEDQQTAYAQYGTEIGSNYNIDNPYNNYNPTTAQNQLALINQAQGYDNQIKNAWTDFGNATQDIYNNFIPQAQVGLSTGQTGPHSLQYKDYIDKAIKAAQTNYGQKNKTTFYDPNTGEWKVLDIPQGQQQTQQQVYTQYPYNQERYDSQGLRYFPTNYSPYIKWNARGNTGTSANWSELLSKYNPSDTRLLEHKTNYRKGLGKLLWGPEVKSETYKFRSHLDPEEFQGTNVSNQPSSAAVSSAQPTSYNIPAGIAKPITIPNTSVYNTLVPSYLQTKKLGGLPKAQWQNSIVGAPYATQSEGAPYANWSESPAETWKKNAVPHYNAPVNTNINTNTNTFSGPNTISGYGYADAWGGNQPAPTAVDTFGTPQGQLTGDQFKTNPEPLTGKSPDSKYFDWNLKGKKKLGINGEPLAQGIMAGTNVLTSFANASDRQNALNQMNANTLAQNQFASIQRPNKGDYNWTGMSTGMLSPNQYVPVQQPGVTPSYMSAYGGQYAFGGDIDQDGIYDLSEDEIQNILANGGQIEYLD